MTDPQIDAEAIRAHEAKKLSIALAITEIRAAAALAGGRPIPDVIFTFLNYDTVCLDDGTTNPDAIASVIKPFVEDKRPDYNQDFGKPSVSLDARQR